VTETFTQTAPDSTGVKIRGATQTIGAHLVQMPPVSPQWGPTPAVGYTFGFSIAGSATTTFRYFSLWNPVGSGKILLLRRFILECVAITQANNRDASFVFRTTTPAPTGGTLQPASAICKVDSNDPDPSAELRTNGPTAPGLVDYRKVTGIHRPETAPGTQLATRTAERHQPNVPHPPIAVLREEEGFAWANGNTIVQDVDSQFFCTLAWQEVAALP